MDGTVGLVRERGDSGRFGGILATKSKLEKAVEKGAASLNEAQREIVISQFSEFKKNKARILEIETTLRTSGREPSVQRSMLSTERAQLISSNNEIADRLFKQLQD